MQLLQENGIKVPEEISVCGFDDTPLCEMVCPTLTTVKQDNSERAQKAISLLKQMKEGTVSGMTYRLPVELVIRKSTPFQKHWCK